MKQSTGPITLLCYQVTVYFVLTVDVYTVGSHQTDTLGVWSTAIFKGNHTRVNKLL